MAKTSTNGRMVGGKDGTSRHARQTEEFAGAMSMAQHTRRSNSGSFIRSQSMGDVDLKKAIESNHQLYQPSQKPKQREVFFKELKKGYGFKKAVKRCYPKKYLKNIVKTVLYNVKFMGGQNRYQVIVVMATKGRLK